jgi:hypothetical protein
MNMLAVADFGSIGTAIAFIVIAFMQVWEKRRSTKRDVDSAKRDEIIKVVQQTAAVSAEQIVEIKASTEKTAEKVEEVHRLSNGGMGEQLLIGMVSAQTLFEVSGKPEHGVLADAAKARCDAHMKTIKAGEATAKAVL